MNDRLLIDSADVVVTMDPRRREIACGSVLLRGGMIEAVGSAEWLGAYIREDPGGRTPSRTLNARGTVVLPGLVNGHHHLYARPAT